MRLFNSFRIFGCLLSEQEIHMEHFWVTGLIALVFSSLVSSEQKYIVETPDCSACIWSWDTSAYVQFPGLSGTWYQPALQRNRYGICNRDNLQEPNNWLRSYVITVGDIQRLNVTFRYFSQQCSQSAPFCKESFYAYVWESNRNVTAQQIPHPINNFQLYRRFANIIRKSDHETNLTVPLHVTNRYIVLGIRDQGGCRTLFSVKVSYMVCPEKTLEDSLVFLPSTVSLVESTPVQGICMANSRQIVPGDLTVFCDSDGEWNTSRLENRCVCKEDMENARGVCTACPGGTYNEGRGLNCTETPSKPRNASVYFVNESSAILTWLIPEITGTQTNVSYDVDCRPSCEYFSGCEDKTCNSDINSQLTREGLKTTIFTPGNLASFVNYTCKITAKNRVSKIAAAKTQASESERSVTYVTLRTKGSVPDAPEYDSVAYHTETNSITLSWLVKCKNGIIQEYRIEYFSVDDSSGSKTLSTGVNKIQIGSLPAGKTLRFQVYAVNNFGRGSPGVTTFHIPKAPQQKCKLQSECHEHAKCFMGFCVCQSNFTGNGKFCREGQTCSVEELKKCGNHSNCIADPILPDYPVCRCLKGFRLNNKKSCEDIDECKTFRAKCKESRCVNTIGSFICTKCKPGFINGPEGQCVADDECGGCGENEECHEGKCYCKEGYDMDQFKKCYSTEGDNRASSLQLICGLWMFLLNFLLH